MPFAEVLGWIGTTNRVGVLTIRGVGSETMLSVRDGRILECAAVDPPVLLRQFLLFHGVIDEEVLDRAIRAHTADGRRLGDVLLEMGAVTSENMDELLAAKAEETVLSSFDHPTGWFTFEPDATTLPAPLTVDMSIKDAIDRGDKRVKSAAVAAAVLRRSGCVLRKTAKPPSAKLSSVWSLRNAYALVDGERSIDEIVLHMHGTEFYVVQRLHQLFLERFIEVVELGEPSPSSESETVAPAIRADADSAEPLGALEGIIPVSAPPEFVRASRNLSIVEKYLLTLCDGTRDVRKIRAIAPIQSQVVLDTIQSLSDRGWLKASA
jgi:ketosteroid isomerase-like protein